MRAVRLTGWRKIASAVWGNPGDPQIYGQVDVDASGVLGYMEAARGAGRRVTATHLVGKALAHAIAAAPDLNVVIRGSRAFPRSSVDIFFIAAVDGGRDLSGVKVTRVDERPVIDLADEVHRRATLMREGEDPDFARTKGLMERLPRPLLRASLAITAWIAGGHGRGIRALSVRPSPFGSAMVTSLGMFGVPMGFAPISWLYRVPILVMVGEVTQRPVAVAGQVEVRPILPLTATIDHRYADGWHISQLLTAFRAYLADPAAFEPPLPGRGATG